MSLWSLDLHWKGGEIYQFPFTASLQLPNHLFWLLSFYFLFHSVMNLIGELLLFGDRRFYDDWWNAETVWKFWRTWNVPVHRWASR